MVPPTIAPMGVAAWGGSGLGIMLIDGMVEELLGLLEVEEKELEVMENREVLLLKLQEDEAERTNGENVPPKRCPS